MSYSKEELAAYQKEYRLRNKEKLQARRKEYYLQNRERDKEYSKKYYISHRQEILEKAKTYQREHYSERVSYRKGWEEDNKEYVRERARLYAESHREKYHLKDKARRLTDKLTKQSCQICGAEKAEAHHCDYNKPLEVMWLCKKHHVEWHKNNEAIEPKGIK